MTTALVLGGASSLWDDIEAALELAPAARKSSLGVAKKKPE
jgi:hypothetical protein